jgi:hypothetical protein
MSYVCFNVCFVCVCGGGGGSSHARLFPCVCDPTSVSSD